MNNAIVIIAPIAAMGLTLAAQVLRRRNPTVASLTTLAARALRRRAR